MLTFNLKKEWFEKIKSGKKTHEYREYKPYWTKRIKKELGFAIENRAHIAFPFVNRKLPTPKMPIIICFKLGYPSPQEHNKIIYAKMESLNITNGLNTDLLIDKEVFDIEFKTIENFEEYRKKHLIVDDIPEVLEKIKTDKIEDYFEIYKRYFILYKKENHTSQEAR